MSLTKFGFMDLSTFEDWCNMVDHNTTIWRGYLIVFIFLLQLTGVIRVNY